MCGIGLTVKFVAKIVTLTPPPCLVECGVTVVGGMCVCGRGGEEGVVKINALLTIIILRKNFHNEGSIKDYLHNKDVPTCLVQVPL